MTALKSFFSDLREGKISPYEPEGGYYLVGLFALTYFLHGVSDVLNMILALMWGIFLVYPIWIYARKGAEKPLMRAAAYFVCFMCSLAGFALIAVIFLKIF